MLEFKKEKQFPYGPLFGAGCNAQIITLRTRDLFSRCIFNHVVFSNSKLFEYLVCYFISVVE